MDSSEAAKNALECVLEAKRNERLVIFCDDVRTDVGEAFRKGAEKLGLRTTYVLFKTSKTIIRKKIPIEYLPLLTTERPDIYVNILTGTREETPFRIKLIHAEAGKHQTRLAHCPGITMDMLTEGALALTTGEHRSMQGSAETLMKKMEDAVNIELTTPAGTNLTFGVENRKFFTDTKIDWVTLKWMNLPTGEVIVAPVENFLEGTLVCDMAIGGIGPLKTPLTITVKNGSVQKTESEDAVVKKRVDESLATDHMAKVVGEFAVGINPKARLIEEFLETEKIKGTVHIAFGDNTDFPGGRNDSANHMDFLMNKPTVKIHMKNNEVITVLEDGVFKF
jgi:leucyl aminopeptidase (aminopeptidase T)